MTTLVALRDVLCGNQKCPYRQRHGRAMKVGAASLDAIVQLKCPSCREIHVYRIVIP